MVPWRQLFLLVLWMGVLSGCSTGFSPLSVSESELQGYLTEAVKRFDHQQIKAGSPLSVRLRQADVRIGPDRRDVVELSIAGEVAVNALMTRLPVDVALKVEGTPVFLPEERAVYIKRLALLDSRLETPLFKGDLKPVTDMVMRAVAQLLETTPVYRFDESSMTGKMLQMSDLQLKVVPGKLVLVPGE